MARKNKTFFFDAPDSSSGTRFCRFNHPTKDMFKSLFDSIPFILDDDDAAKEAEAGHTRKASDAQAIARESVFTDKHSRAVQPHQLPLIILNQETEVAGSPVTYKGLTITPVTKTVGSVSRLSYRIELERKNSIDFDVDNVMMLVKDIEDSDLNIPTNQEKFYGIRGGARGFIKVLPDWVDDGTLKCRDNNGTLELYWDTSAVTSAGRAYQLLNSMVEYSLPQNPNTPVLKTYLLPVEEYVIGAKLKFSAVFWADANNSGSLVYCRLKLVSGNECTDWVAEAREGNQSGHITMEGEIDIGSDVGLVPDIIYMSGKTYNSAEPSEVTVNHLNNWDFAGDETQLQLQFCAQRATGTTAAISLRKLTIEIIK